MKVVIVTGGSRGLGRAIALRYGSAGYSIVINFKEKIKEAEIVADEIERIGGKAILIRADVRRADEVAGMIDTTTAKFGKIDILINNAAINRDRLLIRMDEDDWTDIIDTNLKGVFNCMRAATKVMVRGEGGHIINISSLAAISGRAGQACYAASKAGLIGLSRSAAREFAKFNVMVNLVIPGFMEDGMGESLSSGKKDRIMKENILGRSVTPEETANFIVQLTSRIGTTGQIFNLDSRIAL